MHISSNSGVCPKWDKFVISCHFLRNTYSFILNKTKKVVAKWWQPCAVNTRKIITVLCYQSRNEISKFYFLCLWFKNIWKKKFARIMFPSSPFSICETCKKKGSQMKKTPIYYLLFFAQQTWFFSHPGKDWGKKSFICLMQKTLIKYDIHFGHRAIKCTVFKVLSGKKDFMSFVLMTFNFLINS